MACRAVTSAPGSRRTWRCENPAAVVGVHVNTDMLAAAAVMSFAGVSLNPEDFDEGERPLVQRMNAFVADGLGYIALQGTRPRRRVLAR